jgi:hypothetical protein
MYQSIPYCFCFQDELEEDVQKEVEKVLSELTLDVKSKIAKAPQAPEASIMLPEPEQVSHFAILMVDLF